MIAKLNARLNNILDQKVKIWAERTKVLTLKFVKWTSLVSAIGIWVYLIVDWVIRFVQYQTVGTEFPRSAFIMEAVLVIVSLIPTMLYMYTDRALMLYKHD